MNILLDGTQLEQVNSVRYLGLEVDDNLTWELHVQNLCKLIAFQVHSLTRPRHTINKKLLDLLYKTTIQPCFDYARSVWGNYTMTSRKALLRLQKRAARVVYNTFDFIYCHGEDIKQLSWQTLQQMRVY